MSETTDQENAAAIPIEEPLEDQQAFSDSDFLYEFELYRATKDEHNYVIQTLMTTTERMAELQRRAADLQSKLTEHENAIKAKFVVLRKQ